MEPGQWDRVPEQVAAAAFVRREPAPRHTVLIILPMPDILTGEFRMEGTPMEEISMEVIPTAWASVQAVEAFHGEEEEDAPLVAADADGGGNVRFPS